MDTEIKKCFIVHKSNGTAQKYIKSLRGLYYHDMRWLHDSTVLTNTVANNKSIVNPRSLKLTEKDKAKIIYSTCRKLREEIDYLRTRSRLYCFLTIPNSPKINAEGNYLRFYQMDECIPL